MGDGPMWIPITTALRDAVDACASSVPDCDINASTINATFEKQYPPWSQLATWDGQRTADALFLFISFGYQCGKCAKLMPIMELFGPVVTDESDPLFMGRGADGHSNNTV
jgi:hypothetical protein